MPAFDRSRGRTRRSQPNHPSWIKLVATSVAATVDADSSWLASYAAVLPDTTAATDLLWRDLVAQECSPAKAWLELAGGGVVDVTSARHGLLLLVSDGGWRNVKLCDQPSCQRPFLDRSLSASRKGCGLHRRKRALESS